MYGVFLSIRKRAAKRRFVALWLCLVAIELFCPALCGEQTYAATSKFPQTEIRCTTITKSDASEMSLSSCNNQGEHDQLTVCNDECLCHATAIPGLAFSMESVSVQTDRISLLFAESIFSSLPPPYLPPKFS